MGTSSLPPYPTSPIPRLPHQSYSQATSPVLFPGYPTTLFLSPYYRQPHPQTTTPVLSPDYNISPIPNTITSPIPRLATTPVPSSDYHHQSYPQTIPPPVPSPDYYHQSYSQTFPPVLSPDYPKARIWLVLRMHYIFPRLFVCLSVCPYSNIKRTNLCHCITLPRLQAQCTWKLL